MTLAAACAQNAWPEAVVAVTTLLVIGGLFWKLLSR